MNRRFIIVILIIMPALAVFVATAKYALFAAPQDEIVLPSGVATTSTDETTKASVKKVSSNHPTRITIPSVDVDARVTEVGIAYSGNMAPPKAYADVGWYKYGTIPGRLGSAVMAGHVDNGLSLPGVFKRLHEVKKGDEIFILDTAGVKRRFVITNVTEYSYTSVPTEEIFTQNDKAYLRLITCAGGWVQKDRTYDTRIVVTAELPQ